MRVGGAMAARPFDFWNHWSIQILVLISLSCQVALFLLAGIRLREAHWFFRGLLWLAYQLADSTAIYALGHLSVSSVPRNHQLVAFWASLLLLHLGGPDNITAYSLEDSKLWKRHMLTLVLQVLGAAYVLYKQIAVNGSFVHVAAFLMFVVGFVKYAERTWALKCGGLDSIKDSLSKKKQPGIKCHFNLDDGPPGGGFRKEEFLVRRAHSLFHICKCAVVDFSVDMDADHGAKIFSDLSDDNKYEVSGIELSLMYDILYTKAAVVHCVRGYCIRVASVLATATSLLLFQLSTGKEGQNRVDVAVTYTLLSGAFLLEMASLLGALGSSWTFPFLCDTPWTWLRHAALCSASWDRFRGVVISFPWRIAKMLRIITCSSLCWRPLSRRWSGGMGQYNMLDLCICSKSSPPLPGRLANMLGLKDRWEREHYSWTIGISKEVEDSVFRCLRKMIKKDNVNTFGMIRKDWGRNTLERYSVQVGTEGDITPGGDFRRSLGVEFQEAVIIWHIGTEVFLSKSKHTSTLRRDKVEAVRALSNYMMFLLVRRTYMLPGLAQNRLYQRTYQSLEKAAADAAAPDDGHTEPGCSVLKQLFGLRDDPNPRCPLWERVAGELVKPRWKNNNSRLIYAMVLGETLIDEEEKRGADTLELVLDMWTDFLLYAANRCSRESHAKKLNNGGELTTLIWLLTEHFHQVDVSKEEAKEAAEEQASL